MVALCLVGLAGLVITRDLAGLYAFVYEIAEDEVRYRYGLVGASVGQCLMSNIVRVVGPDEEGISI